MRFSAWYPIAEAPLHAPPESGVLQTRGSALLALPRGKSAMCLYAASSAGQSLADLLASPQGVELMERAAHHGAHLVRFAVTRDPQAELSRVERDFRERFGAAPIGNRDSEPPSAD